MSSYRTALAVPEFRAIFAAHVVSMAGVVTANFALTVLVYSRTGSALLSSLVFTLVLAPHLIAGTLLSALIDRFPPRRLLVSCNLLSATLVTAISLSSSLPVAAVLVLAFTLGLIEPVFSGARAATLPDVLPGDAYVSGRSLMRLVAQGAQMGGFAVGGLLMAAFTPRVMLLVNAGCFLFSAALLRFGTRKRVPDRDSGAARPTSLLRDSLNGLGAVMKVPAVRRILFLGWAVPALGVVPEALAVPYTDGLGGGTTAAGLLLTAIPLGTMTGEVLTNWLVPKDRQIRMIGPAALLVFAPMLLFALRPGLVPAIVVLFVCGLGFSTQLGQDRLLLQVVPDELRGRTLSLQMAGLMFWQGLGFAAGGAVAELFAPHVVICAAAVSGLLVIVLLLRGALLRTEQPGSRSEEGLVSG
ncbi:MFS transporter [Kitasatospora sp. NPDC056783]|uniref:MFS transporter n=1 Tax=Kitasatospora sp. NPDC056783 TaxID=3345943 RepID=UPI0036878A34